MTTTPPPLPNDVNLCHRLLLAAYQQTVGLEQQLAASQQQVAELNRVLDETANSFEELQREHTATVEELASYKRQLFGRRRERHEDGQGQQYLFDLAAPDSEAPTPTEECQQVAGHTRRRRKRELDLSHLPHHRHELDLSAEEKICPCCNRTKDRIGEDVTKILEYVPSKLEVHEHVRPKYACRYCKVGVSSPPPPQRPLARSIAGPGLLAQIIVSKYGDHRVQGKAVKEMRVLASRGRDTGLGCKPPQAAWVKSLCRERCGKGAANASGKNRKDERKRTADEVSKP